MRRVGVSESSRELCPYLSTTRVELAELTGLTPQAVSKIIARLVAAGLVAEGGTRNVGVGKPRTLLTVVPGGAPGF